MPGSTRAWLASIARWTPSERRLWLDPRQIEVADRHWRLRANPEQLEVSPDWSTWLVLGGRGSGKTWIGAGWTVEQALDGARIALVGASYHDVREVMIEGPSGLRAQNPRSVVGMRYEASRRRVVWDNGSVAQVFSAEDVDGLRGPQFSAAWADEFCAWRRPGETLAMLRFGLRLGIDPRLVVTTTPRPIAALRRLAAEAGVARSNLPTNTNAHNLAPGFLRHLDDLYGGTKLAAQELDGLIVEGEGALWTAETLARCRGGRPPELDRIVVAVDPPATAGGDACGIVVAGRLGERAFVLADATVRGLTPNAWAGVVCEAARRHGADAIVAESNQGGDMVRELIARDAPCAVKMVRARWSKRVRAEPVAALYEQGRVIHCGAFPALEEELMSLGCAGVADSPDRADALVWALTDLMLGRGERTPRVRVL